MKDMTTKDFCRVHGACREGTKFALQFKTMRECYNALLNGEAGNNSADWAVWVATTKGVFSDRELRLFAVKCARLVQHLMEDSRSVNALDVAERFANGEATEEELRIAKAEAEAAADAAADAARHVADFSAASVISNTAYAVYSAYSAAAASAASASFNAAYAATYAAWAFRAASADDARATPYAHTSAANSDISGEDHYTSAYYKEKYEHLKILAKFGNPFLEDLK